MGKNKLKKFAEMKGFSCVLEYPFAALEAAGGFPLRGRWRQDYFHNAAPIVLELGCGKGEYTVGLAQAEPSKNYIGIDIKGARIWRGAKTATEQQMTNVAFIRTGIELLASFFAPGEVDEIWITFPDPQMQKTRKRLVSARFLELYRQVLRPDGLVHLKTDSPFLYTFADRLVSANSLPIIFNTPDLYAAVCGNVGTHLGASEKGEESDGRTMVRPYIAAATQIQTFYEKQWLARGKSIRLISFRLPADGPLSDPAEDDIPRDDYRSVPRGVCFPETK